MYFEEVVIDQPEFSVNSSGDVSITSQTGTTIRYTTDGTDPTTSSTTYSTPILSATVLAANSIKAIAVHTDYGITSAVATLPVIDYTYNIVNHSGEIAIQATERHPAGYPLGNDYNSIPSEIRSIYLGGDSSPYLGTETVTFKTLTGAFSTSALEAADAINKTPSTPNLYITYTANHLMEKIIHLRGARAMNITVNGDYIYDNNGSFGHKTSPTTEEKSQNNYLWYVGGHDPYGITIYNAETENYLHFATPSTLSLDASPSHFIIMEGSADGVNPTYEQLELMAATGGSTYYRVGRTGDAFNISTTSAGNASLQVQVIPNTSLKTFNLIDRAGKKIASVSSSSGILELPDELKSPLASYHYWNSSSFDEDENEVFTLKPAQTELSSISDAGSSIFVTYDVNSSLDITGGTTYLLKFLDGASFKQENGEDGLQATAAKGVYPYNNGDFNLYIYGDDEWDRQTSSGASTRTRWLWYIVSNHNGTDLTGDDIDPYHVIIKSRQNQSYILGDVSFSSNSYLRTYKPNNDVGVVTGVVTQHSSVVLDGLAPTEYMLLGSDIGHLTLKTVDEIDGDRQTVNSFEQYWKTYETVSDRGTYNYEPPVNNTAFAGISLNYYQGWAYSRPIDTSSPTTENAKVLAKGNHFYQKISMGSGQFAAEEVLLEPEVILLDQHGWEVMRVPFSQTEKLRQYDSPMVDTYYWHPSATKVSGYHKFTDLENNIKIYTYNDGTKKWEWKEGDPTYTFTSNTLAADPYTDHSEQPSNVRTDFYVTYTVKSTYATSYQGAATEGATVASSFFIKQGGSYAKLGEGNALTTVDEITISDNIPTNIQWKLKPNFNIDAEMGYVYANAAEKTSMEAAYYAAGQNGFDPYNVQIQSVANTARYFTTNTASTTLSHGVWTGTSSTTVSTKALADDHISATGYDQVVLDITNSTFMVVGDANNNMRLMPRFDNTKIVTSFTSLTAFAAVAPSGDNGAGNQSFFISSVPTVITSTDDILSMEGNYILSDGFNLKASIGSAEAPFQGTIDGVLHKYTFTKPLVAYASGNAVIKNVILDNVNIDDPVTVNINGGDKEVVGAICNYAYGNTRIYNCGILATNSTAGSNSSTVSGNGYVGGIVGLLNGYARVINCFSYADITGGTDKGGIVGYNNYATNKNNLRTMVMNCMFYGNIASGGNISPIYAGKNIVNKDANGIGNFNYFLAEQPYVQNQWINVNNGNSASMAEARFLQRFEFFRHLLNGHRELAAWWATGDAANKDEMKKWVMEPSQIGTTTPYPILQNPGKYPSVVNIDAESASTGQPRNQGGKLGTLAVSIEMGSNSPFDKPAGATITTDELTLNITDKDTLHYNFNYYKVQLPYYNDVGTKNYTGDRVVVGWKITSITGGTSGTFSVPANDNTPADAPYYNYADRNCTDKDLYSVSHRVFNQGDYWDVPEGVTGITIQPYWAKAAYVADDYRDVVYNTNMNTKYDVTTVGGGQWFTNGESHDFSFKGETLPLTVYNTIANAITALSINKNHKVYDYAIVLAGNYHQYGGISTSNDRPYSLMSIDLDCDNEPDYSYILRFDSRAKLHPLRVDFLSVPGLGMAQKSSGGTGSYNFGIPKPKGWFEVTNTALFRVTQFEYCPEDGKKKPIILHGGVIEQWVSSQGDNSGGTYDPKDRVNYYHVGDNVWFKEFHIGIHQDYQNPTPHPPVTVTGGDYEKFYLTGLYRADATPYDDNAECYINGGRFGIVGGAGYEGIGNATNHTNGNITWEIDNADIKEFYGGGLNFASVPQGNITTTIKNSYVDVFCGGPKFGDMPEGKTVTTTATNCHFGTYFGAGYGGNSYNRIAPKNQSPVTNIGWNSWVDKEYTQEYSSTYGGVSTQIDYQFIPMSGNTNNVARIFVDYVSFSSATTHDVTSTLTGCTITGNYYGGGSLGKVDGPVTSTLNNCTVDGSVFGAGYSAKIPTIEVMNTGGFLTEPYYYTDFGTYRTGVLPATVTYTWEHSDVVNNTATAIDKTNHILYTTEDLTTLGTVSGQAQLTITGNTVVSGNIYDNEGNLTADKGGVFGGGDESDALGKTEVNIGAGGSSSIVNVFGGGNTADVGGNTVVNVTSGNVTRDVYGGGKGRTTVVNGNVTVNIGEKDGGGVLSGSGRVEGNVYGGSALGNVNASKDDDYDKDTKPNAISAVAGKATTVNIYGGTVDGSVFGGGLGQTSPSSIAAKNFGATTVNMEGGTVQTAVYGGSNANGVLESTSTVTITGGTVGTAPLGGDIANVVFGGGYGEPTIVEGNVALNIGNPSQASGGATLYGHIYGGGALGSVNSSTQLNLNYGIINGNVFGGGLGKKAKAAVGEPETEGYEPAEPAIAAVVGGNATVTLNGATLTYSGVSPVTGQIFGGNNLNGSPSGHIKVHVKKTVPVVGQAFDVAAVYGGGNEADYDAAADDFAEVIIEGCDVTSIKDVYGGGNAAAVPATEVLILGTKTIDNVFGGGNGELGADHAAHVGFHRLSDLSKSDYTHGTGRTEVKLVGGTITNVYGGSNSNGDIRGGANITMPAASGYTSTYDCCSALNVTHIYGGGKNADMSGGTNIVLGCMPNSWIDEIYAGAQNADVAGDVSLTITSGKFKKVFGGNKDGGKLEGSITVNIEETGGCDVPIIIGELYGGGNLAGYSIYGYDGSGNPRTEAEYNTWFDALSADDKLKPENQPYDNPKLNVRAFTSIGAIYGGGLSALMIGDPSVDINVVKGSHADDAYIHTETVGGFDYLPAGTETVIYPAHKKGEIGSIGNVYGGGKNGNVVGNTTVNIGTETSVDFITEPAHLGTLDTDYTYDALTGLYSTTVEGANITGNVYGGGQDALINGDTQVNICAKKGDGDTYTSVTANSANVKIAGAVFGAGKGLTTNVNNTKIVMAGGSVAMSVYGGGEFGSVEQDTHISIMSGNIGDPDNEHGGATIGNVYGGGQGECDIAHTTDGLVKGNTHVTITGGNIYHNVYGGGAYGSVGTYTVEESVTTCAVGTGSATININGGTIGINGKENGMVFGSSRGEVVKPTGSPAEDPNDYLAWVNETHVTIGDSNNETPDPVIKGSVYGSGENGHTYTDTEVIIHSGTIGINSSEVVTYYKNNDVESDVVYSGPAYDYPYRGNVYGGGCGTDQYDSDSDGIDDTYNPKSGWVGRTASVTIDGGTVVRDVYGGGSMGSVGGSTSVEISGNAVIGASGSNGGYVYAATRGDASLDDAHQAYVAASSLTISGGTINGDAYGGGQNGIVKGAVAVSMSNGTVKHDVYGGGALAKTNTEYDAGDEDKDDYVTTVSLSGGVIEGDLYGGGLGRQAAAGPPAVTAIAADVKGPVTVAVSSGKANRVFGCNNLNGAPKVSSTVSITGTTAVVLGSAISSVYGGGNQAPYTGNTSVSVSGGKVGYVYGGGLGASAVVTGNTSVAISGGIVNSDVFGGGSQADVTGSVEVAVSGGKVTQNVYGGGALANTNTANWDTSGSYIEYVAVTPAPTVGETAVAGYFTRSGDVYTLVTFGKAETGVTYYRKKVVGTWEDGQNDPSTGTVKKTTVKLSGGLVGDVYGGGLGQVESGTYGMEGYIPSIEANVYGDVLVTVNDPAEISRTSGSGVAFIQETEDAVVDDVTYPTYVSGRVFGCNNLNGTPTGDVTVHVYSTRQIDSDNNIISGHGSSDRKYTYEIQAVYGGGNQADYLPAGDKKSKVIIDGCEDTSIEKVYGGGNSAVMPNTDVLINGAYDIGYAFGGGNGGQPIKKNGVWQENEGAIVINMATIVCDGGKIGQVFGAGDAKGSCGNTTVSTRKEGEGTCPLHITRLYGAGNSGDVGNVNIILAACTGSAIDYVHGGSYNAHIDGDVILTITGGILKNVYGGNDARGGIGGNIIVNIEETDPCTTPIVIQNLVGGGNMAPYPGTYKDGEEEVPYSRKGKITVNVKSATRIDNVYGGSFQAEANADTEVNINMIKGSKAGAVGVTLPIEFRDIPNIRNITPSLDGKSFTCTIKDSIGTIGNVYGGGNMGLVRGSAVVNIGTADSVKVIKRDGDGNILDTEGHIVAVENGKNITAALDSTRVLVRGAHITGNVFGGGNLSNVSDTTWVNICTKKNGSGVYEAVAEGAEGVSIGNTVYGGGNAADVLGNTHVNMYGGYVFNGVAGGGLSGSVGTVTSRAYHTGDDAHSGCVGKPTAYAANTGKCNVVIMGGQVGPVEVATEGMTRAVGGPVEEGWVWGAGRGIVADPILDPDSDYKTYVKDTDVTIGGTAFILASVIGGGEFGRVQGNTVVKIQDHCQIGVGEGQTETVNGVLKPKRYTDGYDYGSGATTNQFVDPTTTPITESNALKECSHWPYGRNIGTEESPNWVYLPFDQLYDKYSAINPEYTIGPASTAHPSDGKTWIGCVFGGGSGYVPYEKEDNTGYAWARSAGLVEGNAEVRITGGHILTNVYGGNEYTDVKGKCTVKMSGGTIGVPRTLDSIAAHPVTCYLFGAGRGDQRAYFNEFTNVGSTEVEVSGGIIYGSVFGGAEDGHVLGNTTVTIKEGAKIGTFGTSYVDGNIFGGGRGFAGQTLGAGSVSGNCTVDIQGGTMLGSVYGGGRLASVGCEFSSGSGGDLIGNFKEDDGEGTYGHITINISGGVIGNSTEDAEIAANGHYHTKGGNVYGGSMGRLELQDGSPNPLWPRLAQTKDVTINISGDARIKNSVYGGSEFGNNRDNAYVTIGGVRVAKNNISRTESDAPTICGHVYGGGYGSIIDADDYKASITSDVGMKYIYTPMMFAGCVGGDTEVNICGGHVQKNVYGGGEMASVGVIDYRVNGEDEYINIHKHDSIVNKGTITEQIYNFGLSWPYEYSYLMGGNTVVNVTGGRVGTTINSGYGYVFGGGKGKAMERYKEAFCGNVKESEVNIHYSATPDSTALATSSTQCIVGAVYGGPEDGHVYEDATVDISGGLIGMSAYGGGKGRGFYRGRLRVKEGSTDAIHDWKNEDEDLLSLTAGKVYGNTSITVRGGCVLRNIYGGGNRASVGKGNYSSGTDDYYPAGYGETLDKKLWTSTKTGDYAWHFLNSGRTDVIITSGTIGTVKGTYDNMPTGMVFGGSRGQSAEDVFHMPRYDYAPEFFLGYVNRSHVRIGQTDAEYSAGALAEPKILGSVYGGGRDGHVRDSAEVIVYRGTIGLEYNSANQTALGTSDVMSNWWRNVGNVYGSGSGLGTWDETHHAISSGSVTRKTAAIINGGTIYNNVYGGGAMSSVGPPLIGTLGSTDYASKDISLCRVVVNGGYIGTADGYNANYGGSVYGATRGGDFVAGESEDDYATVIWTKVDIKGGTIRGDVYGGGQASRVKKDTEVNLTGGDIAHDAYGGGRGHKDGIRDIAANIGGNATVELNKGLASSARGCSVGRIFGCNNLLGTPRGNVLVHVYATRHKNQSAIVPSPGGKYNLFSNISGYSINKYDDLVTLAEGTYGLSSNIASYKAILSGSGTDETKNAALKAIEDSVLYAELKDFASAGKLNLNVTVYTDIIGATGGSYTAEQKAKALEALKDTIYNTKYDVLAVYGGGNLAPYQPYGPLANNTAADFKATTKKTQVIIDGCSMTSIRQVYGGGNAASTPANSVTVYGTYEIDELFGGGNGKDPYREAADNNKWYANPGANVGYYNFMEYKKSGDVGYDAEADGDGSSATPYVAHEKSNASTADYREANYGYGSGEAETNVVGGRIHSVYGGSNMKGTIRELALSVFETSTECPVIVDQSYGAGKNADIDGEIRVSLDCVEYMAQIFGGSKDADVNSNVNLTITNGHFGEVYGGNNTSGNIYGSINVTIKESGCNPIVIDKLYAGGYKAAYSVYGYYNAGTELAPNYLPRTKAKFEEDLETALTGVDKNDEDAVNAALLAAGLYGFPKAHPQLDIISATLIGDIYGGGNQALLIGTPHINVNMEEGYIAAKWVDESFSKSDGKFTQASHTVTDNGTTYTYVVEGFEEEVGSTHGNAILRIGTIGNIHGGGDQAVVDGDTHVEIGTGTHHVVVDGEEEVQPLSPYRDVAEITNSVYGGGRGETATVTGNTYITIGNGANIYNRVFGGGDEGSVGTVTSRTNHTGDDAHEGCIGKPTAFAPNTGKCTITVTGGQVGPKGMTMPNDYGYVFGASKGKLADPAVDKDIHFKTYVDSTVVIIRNGYIAGHEDDDNYITKPLICGGVYGGSENGRVLHDTYVYIQGGQIGIGAGKTELYDDDDFIDPATSTIEQINAKAAVMPACAGWSFGTPWAPYDENANDAKYDADYYGAASTTGTDGHTFYGNVFGGGSGYFTYTKSDGTFEWLPTAGQVYGDTHVEISGGHILTSVYGGNELTDVTGTCHITMTGGTIGVPRTLAQIEARPTICYLFGAGKGDQRKHFNTFTNVGNTDVNISGGIIYGSVLGGGEDGHVTGNVKMNISGGTIGTWGTSYVDGNVFGGGRGFSGEALTAGNVGGNVKMNISGGTMLGSVYGGGRLGSVGYGLYPTNDPKYGTMRPDDKDDAGNAADIDDEDGDGTPSGFKRGYTDITISGGTIGNNYEYQYIDATNEAGIATSLYKNTVFASLGSFRDKTADEGGLITEAESSTRIRKLAYTKGGNVFAGGMGRRTQLDGTTEITAVDWMKLGNVKNTKLTITGGTIKSNVYGGGELGCVVPSMDNSVEPPVFAGGNTDIDITGGTIGTAVMKNGVTQYTFGSVYGGGMGDEAHHGGDVRGNTDVSISNATVLASVFGGGEQATVSGNATVTISGNTEVGLNKVRKRDGYVMYGGPAMGNVFGGGKGSLRDVTNGVVKGNTTVTIQNDYASAAYAAEHDGVSEGDLLGSPKIYHNVYGGGSLASVGNFSLSDGVDPSYIPAGIPYGWTSGTGLATINITGGTIGISGRDNGMVNGSSRGDDGNPNTHPELNASSWVRESVVNIGTEDSSDLTTPHIKGSVYGGGENGHNSENATVNVYSGTIGITDTLDAWYDFNDAAINKKALATRGNVYGAGCGTDTYTGADGKDYYNGMAGIVCGNTTVNIDGGHVGHCVYGAGSMASVGTVTNVADTATVAKHSNEATSFALSWPYKFEIASGTGKATVNITGGHIGTRKIDGGDVFGAARGQAADRYLAAHLSAVRETEVNINYPSTYETPNEETIQNDFTIPCITGAVHGSGEDGFVYGDTRVNVYNGLIGHSVYGAGKGKGTYETRLLKIGASPSSTNPADSVVANIYSLLAGRVMGNTYVTMEGGHVMRNVYGGGNMGSVGKGNYAGGADDYVYDCAIGAAAGYGENIAGNLWTSSYDPEEAISESNKPDDAYYFLSSGKCTVKVLGGKVGYINATDPNLSMKNELPYGNVFGGSAGEAAPNIMETPRYTYSPAFFSGYVNETDVTIGKKSTDFTGEGAEAAYAAYVASGVPVILGSVYGGGQDGHVRRDTKVTVNNGEIGLPYTDENRTLLKTNTRSITNQELDNPQWLHRGNVYGAGSGITHYKYDFNYDGDYADTVTYDNGIEEVRMAETDYSSSAGSVTRFTRVDINGGIIHRNVYGGGSLASVGPPNMGQTYNPYSPYDTSHSSDKGRLSFCWVNIAGRIGSPDLTFKKEYGGEVYGASRGLSELKPKEQDFSYTMWTKVNVLKTATIKGNVFGGGDSGMVKQNTEVVIGSTTAEPAE